MKLSISKDRDEIHLLKSKLALLSTTQTRNWSREINNCIAEIDGTSSNVTMATKAQQHYGKLYSENLNIEDNNAINKFLQ